MNPLASTASSLAKNLRAEAATDPRAIDPRAIDVRAAGLASPRAAFAGLLGQQQQRLAASPGGSGGSTAYNGSAFDVPPAQRLDTPKPTAASSAQAEAQRALQAQAASRAQQEQAQTQAQTRARAPQTPHPPAAAPAPAPAQARAPEAKPEDAPRPAAPGAAHDGPSSAAEAPASATARGAATESGETPSTATDTQALMDLMARLAQAGGAAAPGGPRGLPGAGGEVGLAGADGAATAGVEGAGRGAGSAVGLEAGRPGLGEALTDTLAETRFDEARPAAPALEGLSAGSHTAGATHASAALGAASLPAAPVADGAVMAQVPTPVTSPDFSQALASQLTTFARDGVQEAQLQLNPADMGPISVQITLDGSQAQIDFAATHARTREALEAAWPALAASLNSAGLTLGGGGVFEQRSGARDGDAQGTGAASGGRRVGEVAEAGEPAARTTVRVDRHRGVLDLYA